jgi:hypothetical protein
MSQVYIERANGDLEIKLSKWIQDNQKRWSSGLPLVVYFCKRIWNRLLFLLQELCMEICLKSVSSISMGKSSSLTTHVSVLENVIQCDVHAANLRYLAQANATNKFWPNVVINRKLNPKLY